MSHETDGWDEVIAGVKDINPSEEMAWQVEGMSTEAMLDKLLHMADLADDNAVSQIALLMDVFEGVSEVMAGDSAFGFEDAYMEGETGERKHTLWDALQPMQHGAGAINAARCLEAPRELAAVLRRVWCNLPILSAAKLDVLFRTYLIACLREM